MSKRNRFFDDYDDRDYFDDFAQRERDRFRRDMKRKKNSFKEHFDEDEYD